MREPGRNDMAAVSFPCSLKAQLRDSELSGEGKGGCRVSSSTTSFRDTGRAKDSRFAARDYVGLDSDWSWRLNSKGNGVMWKLEERRLRCWRVETEAPIDT